MLIAFLVFTNNIFAADLAITDLSVPKVVYADSNFDVNIYVANTDGSRAFVDLNIEFYRPNMPVMIVTTNAFIAGNSIGVVNYAFINVDTNFSNSQHIIRAIITNETNEDPTNNIATQYFVVSKSQVKTPVPDLPIFLGIAVGLFAGFFVISSKKNKKGSNK
jgi:hypothetical protein